MHSVPIPKNGKQALAYDKLFGNTKWRDAIRKEIDTIIEFKVIKIYPKIHSFNPANGWQFAPLHWVYAVKHNGQHKPRLVICGHVTDTEGYNTFASTVQI